VCVCVCVCVCALWMAVFLQPLVVEEFHGEFQFTGNWKGTFTKSIQAKRGLPIVLHEPLPVPSFFSDRLFQPWHCAASPWQPSWFRGETIPRESGLSLEQFILKYESRNLPVILSDVVPSWPAYGKWSREWLLSNYGATKFAAGPVHMTLKYASLLFFLFSFLLSHPLSLSSLPHSLRTSLRTSLCTSLHFSYFPKSMPISAYLSISPLDHETHIC